MKKLTEKQLYNIISFYNYSAYLRSDDVEEIAEEIAEEGEDPREVQECIVTYVDEYLEGYKYIEYEYQGDYYRHIWHKIEDEEE